MGEVGQVSARAAGSARGEPKARAAVTEDYLARGVACACLTLDPRPAHRQGALTGGSRYGATAEASQASTFFPPQACEERRATRLKQSLALGALPTCSLPAEGRAASRPP